MVHGAMSTSCSWKRRLALDLGLLRSLTAVRTFSATVITAKSITASWQAGAER